VIHFSADYFDGQTSRSHPVQVAVAAGQLTVEGEGISLVCPMDQVRVAPPAGQARGIVHLPGGAELHSSDHAALLELSRQRRSNHPEQWARFLESRMRYAVVALLASVVILFAGLRWGVPVLAEFVAKAIPAGVESRLGNESLSIMERIYLSPSELPEIRQQKLSQQLTHYCQQQSCPAYRLHFCNSPAMGANAFALPGGEIVVTDQLIQLAQHDEEVLAVIAHELGHVEGRHGLRLALQSMGAGVLLVAITGDIGSFSDLAAGLPSLLLQSGYSRDMEREADGFALHWMNSACIPARRFADVLQRIAPDAAGSINMLSSHPGTDDRIQPFLTAPECIVKSGRF